MSTADFPLSKTESGTIARPPLNSNDISVLLQQLQTGDTAARESLFRVLLGEMQRLAEGLMQSERADHTLNVSGLVNEACLRILQNDIVDSAENKRHLVGAAYRAMQQVLVDHARNRNAVKRGGGLKRHPLDMVLDQFESTHDIRFADLNEALDLLRKDAPRQHEILCLRFFAGLKISQVARVMGCSEGTVENDWRLARAKLYVSLKEKSDQ